MLETIGFLELNSIAKGVEAADIMLKTATVNLIFAKACCPGKYIILIAGDVAAVKASVEAGADLGGQFVVDKLIIARIHQQVIKAINQVMIAEGINAVGVMEFFSVTGSILGADAAVKAADVTLIDIRLSSGIGGKSFVILTGDTASVEEAVSCGAQFAIENGMLVNKVVIPNPRPEIFESLL